VSTIFGTVKDYCWLTTCLPRLQWMDSIRPVCCWSCVTPSRRYAKECWPGGVWLLHDNTLVHKSMIAQEAVGDCGFVHLDHPAYSPDLTLSDYFCSTIWSLTFMVSAILTMKRSRKLSSSGWRDRQKIFILVELIVCQKNVANALNSVVIILKNKAQLTLSNPRDAKACKNWSHSSLKQVTV